MAAGPFQIATGGSPALPDIPGLKEAPYLTNYSIFNLTDLPSSMGVLGAGPVGLELAQVTQRNVGQWHIRGLC